LGVMIFKI